MKIKGIVLATILVLAVAVTGGAQSWWATQNFLASGVACGTSTTITNGTNFGSGAIRVSYLGRPSTVALTVTFTRVTGSASTVEFYFQVSYDNGTTYSDFHDPVSDADYFSVATNHAAVTGNVVRVTRITSLAGVSHIRLHKIVNNDSSVALTACNASVSW
jgi:hypothetical protein